MQQSIHQGNNINYSQLDFNDSKSNPPGLSMRQTNLSEQLSKKQNLNNITKNKLKTKSFMLLANNNQSNNSLLHDSQSVLSGNSHNHTNNNTININQSAPLNFHYNNNNNNHNNNYNHHPQNQQPYYPQYHNFDPNQNPQPNNYYQHQQHQQHQQLQNNGYFNGNANTKQKYNNRESYMYLNSNFQQNQQQRPYDQSEIPNVRRISGGIVGAPMSSSNDEYAKQLTFNSLIGNHNHSNNSGKYINSIDNEQDWESIDDNDVKGMDSLNKIVETLQLENKNLKRKLKSIELGHDSNSIIENDQDNDEVNFKILESNYSKLNENYELIENQLQNLSVQNTDYSNKVKFLNNEIQNKNLVIENFLDKIPKFLNKINDLNLLVDSSLLSDDLKLSFDESCKKVNLNTNSNTNSNSNSTSKIGTPNTSFSTNTNTHDEDLIEMLRFDNKSLNYALERANKTIKRMDKIFNLKIRDERETIRVSSNQTMLFNELKSQYENDNDNVNVNDNDNDDNDENDDDKPKKDKFIISSQPLKHFRFIDLCPSQNIPINNFNSIDSPTTTDSTSHSGIVESESIATSLESYTSCNKHETQLQRNTITSTESDFKDAHSSVSVTSNNDNDIGIDHSTQLDYETFTA